MALSAGLDLPIMNPNLPQMMWTVKAFKVLAGHDKNSLGFIEYSSDHNPIDVQLTEAKKELDEARAEITAMRSGWAEVAGYAASFAGSDSISHAGSAMNPMPIVPALSISNHPASCTCDKCRAVNKAKAEFAAIRAGRTVTGGMGAAGAESMHVTGAQTGSSKRIEGGIAHKSEYGNTNSAGNNASAGLEDPLGAGILKAMERGLKNDDVS